MNKIIGKDLIVDVKSVYPNTWNPKNKIDEDPEVQESYEGILQEIKNKGLLEAITVRETDEGYEILDGFHRYTACLELKFTKIRINNLGKIDDKLARAITFIKEQKRVNLSEIKVAELIGELNELVSHEELQELVGLSSEEINDNLNLLNFDWDDYQAELLSDEDENIEKNTEEQEHGKKKSIIIKLAKQDFEIFSDHLKKDKQKEVIMDLIEYIKSYL